jgi:hypothetical protein
LRRPAQRWNDFIMYLEALYLVNISPDLMMEHRGDIFVELGKAIRESKPLLDRFIATFPTDFIEEEKEELMRAYNREILPCYAMMRSGDVVKRLNANRSRDRLSLRNTMYAVGMQKLSSDEKQKSN